MSSEEQHIISETTECIIYTDCYNQYQLPLWNKWQQSHIQSEIIRPEIDQFCFTNKNDIVWCGVCVCVVKVSVCKCPSIHSSFCLPDSYRITPYRISHITSRCRRHAHHRQANTVHFLTHILAVLINILECIQIGFG